MPEQITQPKSIPDRNELMAALLAENGVPNSTPSPSPTPPQQRSLGAMLAHLLGLGG